MVLKGYPLPVNVFRLDALEANAAAQRQNATSLKLIGRSAELARIDSPDRLAEALLRQFGLVEWSDATFQAVRRAADADGWTAHDQAFAAAFYSPEVTFS